jgi:hypothetical protein
MTAGETPKRRLRYVSMVKNGSPAQLLCSEKERFVEAGIVFCLLDTSMSNT